MNWSSPAKLLGWFCLAVGLAMAPARAEDIPEAPAPQRAVPMMLNLAPITDWGVQQPFLDVMKTARPWIGHLPGRWGGAEMSDMIARGLLDDQGWPRGIPGDYASIGTILLTDLPPEAMSLAGRYVLRFEGDGIVEVAGRAANVRYGRGEVRFDFTPGPGGVEVRVQRSDRKRTGDHVRAIRIVREDRLPLFDAGAVFNPDWLARIDGMSGLRFMDWMATNNSTLSAWEDRPRPDDFTYAWRGVPLEVMLRLANDMAANPWFTLPHKADDAFVRAFADAVHAGLDPGLRAHVEYSNEVWNWQFAQATWADEQARARWGRDGLWMQFYAMRAAEIAGIWDDVFAGAARGRLVNVISSQTGWLGLEDQVMNAPVWVAENPELNPPPWTFFDAYAVTGYFAGILGLEDRQPMVRDWLAESLRAAETQADSRGLTGAAREADVAAHRFDLAFARAGAEALNGRVSGNPADSVADLLTRVLPYHAQVARDHGLQLIMYEGGTHAVGLGPMVDDAALTEFLTAFNYSPEMGRLYGHLLHGWSGLTDGPFGVYNDVYNPSRWGSWGALRHLGDENPRWDAIQSRLKGPGDDG